jgi:hypothetical protein
MTPDPTAFDPGAALPPPPVGSFVLGPWDGQRQTVRWFDQFRDYHELADHIDPEREAYQTLYQYPAGPYCSHFKAGGYSPRGYVGPASCRYLLFDIDRKHDLDTALTDARTLTRFLRGRYGAHIDDGLAAYFSGSKGFHVLMELMPGWAPAVTGPATCKRLALMIAGKVGVRIDTTCYDHQRLVRLPNSRHPATGLHKRYLSLDELVTLDVGRIKELARDPAGFAVPETGEHVQELEDDWMTAATPAPQAAHSANHSHPAVPKFVRDFIGFADIQDPGRATTLFRCAAALAEVATPSAVVTGLLEEPALKSGLDPAEVRRQIAKGIEHGRKKGGAG